MTTAETSLRLDTLLRTVVNAAMVLRSTPAADVILLAGSSSVMNTSNDATETYRSHIASLGLSLRF
jgi:hypothetical protein